MPITLEHESDNTYRLEISGLLRRSEFTDCEAALSKELERVGSVRLLCVLKDFLGWEPHADWGNLGFYANHGNAIDRIAIVGDERWRDLATMFASADLTLRVKDDAIVIPEAALMPQGDSFAVIVVDAELTAQMRPVKPGVRMAGRVEILEGLKEGETVVVEGWQKTRPGGKVTLAPAEKAAAYTAAAK